MTDLAIELNGVGKSYRFFSLDHINLEVPEGEIMGLIGPNGAGGRWKKVSPSGLGVGLWLCLRG